MTFWGDSHHNSRRLLARFAASLIVALCSTAVVAQTTKWPDVSINGRIVTVTHAGVPAAEVWVTDSDDKKVARTFADGDGYYQLRRLPAGELRIHARAEGMVPGSMKIKSTGFVRAAMVALQEGDALHGVVTMADGTPAAGAAVIVYDAQALPEPFYWSTETTTDEAGGWRIESAPLRPMRVRAFVPGYKIGERAIARGRDTAVKVVMPEERTKLRTVTVTGMKADVPAFVHCLSALHGGVEQLPRAAREVAVAADGTAKVWSLQYSHEMRVSAAGQRSMPIAIPCPVGVDKILKFALSEVPKTVAAPQTEIKGKLVDGLGNPIANVTVVAIEHELRAKPVVTGPDGSFTIHVPANENVLYDIGLLSRKWRLGDRRCKVGQDGITWQSKAVKAGKPIRLHAIKAGTMRGTLIGPNGTPFAAAKVEIITNVKGGPAARIVSATDSAGRIDFAGIPLGPYSLMAGTADGILGTTKVKVFGDQEAALGKLKFVAGSQVYGQVTDPNGKPLSSVKIVFHADHRRAARMAIRQVQFHGNQSISVLTDRDGNFRRPKVVEGDWMAMVAGGRNRRPEPFTVGDKPVELNLIQQ